jgi:hypothetical protein
LAHKENTGDKYGADLIKEVSPVAWQHINLYGRYELYKTPHFRSFWAAWRTLAGYEAIHMIRKGQACVSATGARVGLLHRLIVDMFGIEV